MARSGSQVFPFRACYGLCVFDGPWEWIPLMSTNPIRVLFVEDGAAEAELSTRHLNRAGLPCVSLRVETEEGLRQALEQFEPSVILSDFSLPQFDGLSALRVAHEVSPHVPFIFVSG